MFQKKRKSQQFHQIPRARFGAVFLYDNDTLLLMIKLGIIEIQLLMISQSYQISFAHETVICILT